MVDSRPSQYLIRTLDFRILMAFFSGEPSGNHRSDPDFQVSSELLYVPGPVWRWILA